jgi:predicted ribosomally synthesized peptide with nif11-like leader
MVSVRHSNKETLMSKLALDAFKTKLSQDAGLRDELSRSLSGPAGTPGSTAEDLAAFARARGFEITATDVTQHVELGDAELDQVAGGASDYLLDLDGIKGESRLQGSKTWLTRLSFKF